VLDIDHGQYRLNGDLECPFAPGSVAVTITGDGVHFNLKGYTITRDNGSGQSLVHGILVRGPNAHINNGSVVDFNCPAVGRSDCAGIALARGAQDAKINGMSLHNNIIGILGGIPPGNADGVRVHGNDITGNLRIGIGFFGPAEGAMITGNDLSDTGGFAFGGQGYFGYSDGVSLIGNIANNNARGGIVLWGDADLPPAQRNTIRDNTTLENEIGIVVGGATEAYRARDNLIQSNTSFGNANDDLREAVGEVGIPPDCLNTWKDNDFDFAQPDCIE
jgi:nitrous oxidase accessory protein NosD